MMPPPMLRIVNPDGTYGRVLPDWTSVEVGGDTGEHMVLGVGYRTNADTWPLLGHGTQIAVLVNGVELGDGRFVLDDQADEEVLDADVGTWSGNSLLFALNYAIVYPESWGDPGGNTTTPGWGFAAQTPGQALRELLEAAQARGWNPGLDWDFTDNLDSSGAVWNTTINDFYDMGTTLLDVVTRWKTRKVAVAKMDGPVLQLYRYDTQGVDRSLDQILMRGVDLTEGPVNRSSRNTVSVMLGVTDGVSGTGFGVERTDNPALSTYGRREGFVSQAQIADTTTLAGIVDGTLALKARQREAFTYGLLCGHPARLPFVHFDRGDMVALRVKGATRQMRVRQLSVTWDKDGHATGSAAFGDRKMDAEEQLAQRLEQLTGGSMDAGVFGQPVIGAPDQTPGDGGGGDVSPDTMPPGPPTGLSASSVVLFEQGYLSATATITWSAPTTNADATPLNDLGGFEVQYRHTGYPLWEAGGRYVDDTTTGVLTRLVVGNSYDWRVRALDIWGNASSWATNTFTATNDIIAPAQTPSTPVVATFLFSGLLITWDGQAAGGTAIDNDTRHVEVHISTASGFTPSAGTLKDTIGVGGGQTVVGELTPGTTYYVKLRSVDWAGNIGPSSAQATGVPESVLAGDIANGAVTTLKLADLAVTDGKIANLSATKITAGTLSAVVTLSGSFSTRVGGAGAGWTGDVNGIKLYDSLGNVTVNMDGTTGQGTFNGVLGAANISGYVQVLGTSGSKVVILNSGGTPAVYYTTGMLVEKYPAYTFTAANSFLRWLTYQANSPGSIFLGMTGPPQYTAMGLRTICQDGDFANATTLPTVIHGAAVFSFPARRISATQLGNAPSIELMSHCGQQTMVNVGAMPGIEFRNSDNAQKCIRLVQETDVNSGDQNNTAIAAQLSLGGYGWMRAGNFDNMSAAAMKEDIGPFTWSALQVIRDNPSLRWKFRGESEPYQVGPMADGLPDEVARHGDTPEEHSFRLAAMCGLLWKAVEELMEVLGDRLDVKALEARRPRPDPDPPGGPRPKPPRHA